MRSGVATAAAAIVRCPSAGTALCSLQGLADQAGAERLQVAEYTRADQWGRIGEEGRLGRRPPLRLVPLVPVLVSWKDRNEK